MEMTFLWSGGWNWSVPSYLRSRIHSTVLLSSRHSFSKSMLLALDPESRIVSDGAPAVRSHAKSKHLLQGMLLHGPKRALVRS
ncbi:hypothetical protein EYF80_017108 [Liparis tanakae]|uniref:Uncharacterized protein n=1 Tax=Liparis tanakae TaxID=230148 RepID=A0A4Z2I3L0_9TELE|nr:hypothetical protein EYF80_017108 [Liparis tanakae]